LSQRDSGVLGSALPPWLSKISCADEAVQSWLRRQGEDFPERFTPEAFIAISNLCSKPLPSPQRLAHALQESETKVYPFHVRGDILYPKTHYYEQCQDAIGEGASSNIPIICQTHNQTCGHDTFLSKKFDGNLYRSIMLK
jgi:homoserine acetyltransferase